MRSSKYIYLIFIMIITAGCSQERWEGEIFSKDGVTVVDNKGPGLWEKHPEKKMIFEDDLVLGKEQGEDYLLFYRLRDIAVDSSSNIYIMDAGNHRIIKFDKKGKFIWQTGRKGQGPGELLYPGKISLSPSGGIAVEDGRRIHFFDDHGKYLRTITLEQSYHDFDFFPDARLLVSIFVRGKPGAAADYYSKDGKFLRHFPDEYRYGPEVPPRVGASIGGSIFQILWGKIFFSVPDRYEIRQYDYEGNLLRSIKKNFKLRPPNINVANIGGHASVSVGPSDCSGPCFTVDDKYLINALRLAEKNEENGYETSRFLDFFDEEGRFLHRYPLPGERELLAVDSQRNFYFRETDPFPKIIRSVLKISSAQSE